MSISTCALREEGDWFRNGCNTGSSGFLSTPSARRATGRQIEANVSNWISIHALREEGDTAPAAHTCSTPYFYPRPPRGGRRTAGRCCGRCYAISIHALREEGDSSQILIRVFPMVFLSTPSARRATTTQTGVSTRVLISIHALREEGDSSGSSDTISVALFLATPSARRATFPLAPPHPGGDNFYPRPPRGGRLTRW